MREGRRLLGCIDLPATAYCRDYDQLLYPSLVFDHAIGFAEKYGFDTIAKMLETGSRAGTTISQRSSTSTSVTTSECSCICCLNLPLASLIPRSTSPTASMASSAKYSQKTSLVATSSMARWAGPAFRRMTSPICLAVVLMAKDDSGSPRSLPPWVSYSSV